MSEQIVPEIRGRCGKDEPKPPPPKPPPKPSTEPPIPGVSRIESEGEFDYEDVSVHRGRFSGQGQGGSKPPKDSKPPPPKPPPKPSQEPPIPGVS